MALRRTVCVKVTGLVIAIMVLAFMAPRVGAETTKQPGTALSEPPNGTLVRAKLHFLYNALLSYVNAYDGWYPSDPKDLYPGFVPAADVFWNPGDSDPQPATITNSVRDAVNSSRISFEFPACGKRETTLEPWNALIVDHSPANNAGLGTYVVYADGYINFIPNPLPADTLAKWQTSQTNMRTIYLALATYANDHNGNYPSDLTILYPAYISDPAVFWHPGDSQAAPTTIDNNNPDQLNSTRISYEYNLSAGNCGPVIWDNSAGNNAGYFVTKVVRNGVVTTDPPFITPIPTRSQVGRGNIVTLFMAATEYAMGNDDRYPASLAMLFPAYECSPGVFWHPGDTDPMPTTINNSTPNAMNSALVSFDFPAAGQDINSLDVSAVVLQDNSAANNGGRGRWIVLANGSVRFAPVCNDPFADADGDRDVDAADFAVLQRCLSGSYIILEGCECFNRPRPGYPYGDNDVDADDVDKFIACGSGPGVVADIHCDD